MSRLFLSNQMLECHEYLWEASILAGNTYITSLIWGQGHSTKAFPWKKEGIHNPSVLNLLYLPCHRPAWASWSIHCFQQFLVLLFETFTFDFNMSSCYFLPDLRYYLPWPSLTCWPRTLFCNLWPTF